MRFLTVCFILAFLAFVPAAHGAKILWNTIELRPSGEWDGTTWYALNTPYVSIGAEQMPTGVRLWADASTYMEFAGCLVALQKVVTALGGELSFPVLIGGRDYNLQMLQPV